MLIRVCARVLACQSACGQYAIRRDEANHRDVNHTFANISGTAANPLIISDLEKARRNAHTQP